MEEKYTPLFEEATPMPPPRKRQGKMGLLLVQSICSAVLVLLFWLFKVLGGDSFLALKTAFYSALENNALMETVAGVFNDDLPDETGAYTDDTATTTTVPTTVSTTVTTAPTANG